MAKINPEVLKRLRDRLGLSLEEVQARSSIHKSSIHRLEAGKTRSTRRRVIEKLAGALNTTPEVLTGESVEDSDEIPLFERSQLNVRIPHQVRNALNLVASRYAVQALDIVEMSPLLFYLAAEESLKEREKKLAELRRARESVEALRGEFPHISERLVSDWDAADLEAQEERSIAQRDLRGATLDEFESHVDPRPLDYESDTQNPLVTHLRDRLTAIGKGDEFDYWHEALSPRYVICRDEALAYCGGNEDSADAILYGAVGLHEIPRELQAFEHYEKRNAWIAERRRSNLESLGELILPVLPGGQP